MSAKSKPQVDDQYVAEILDAARTWNVTTKKEWHDLTLRDCSAGYHNEVAEAERIYFSAKPSTRYYEVTVWNQTNGDVVRKVWQATESELDELRAWHADEPWLDIVIDREWEAT